MHLIKENFATYHYHINDKSTESAEYSLLIGFHFILFLGAKKYGKINFITCQTQDQYGIRKTGKDLGVATREKQAIHRSIKRNCSNKVEPSALKKKKNKSKKVTQTSTSSIVNDDLEKEKQMISLREKKFELEEKELKLEKERLEILKLKRELGVTDRQLELIYLPFTKGFDDCLAIDT
ncbi:unnamed protein product [Rhizophagus irregularis]|uniref:No apical meristem-associated C-terminal domain-containing protein n=1 Tax=Rhizophagus irregularis TaxID=588596 RepID=A0A915ZRU2_9GLOM|nr:unnamed protein product [Rhizophagus irregularis]